jgi:cytochrome c6
MTNLRQIAVLVVFALLATIGSFAAEPGADTYKAKCASCHGATGAGDTAMGKNLKLKDLGSAEVQKQSDAELTAVIAKGKKPMPGYEGKLTNDQINDLVKYIRSLKK